MKKTNLIIAGLVLTNLVTIGTIGNMSNKNQEVIGKYDELLNNYDKLGRTYESTSKNYKELEDQVVQMMDGKDYKFTIRQGEKSFITYERTDSDTWFPNEYEYQTIIH